MAGRNEPRTDDGSTRAGVSYTYQYVLAVSMRLQQCPDCAGVTHHPSSYPVLETQPGYSIQVEQQNS
eukprot:COSAG02_NODE_4241_length_5596_cov_4.207932_3_plen_67_part_00